MYLNKFKTFEDLVEYSKTIASKLHTIVEIKEYHDYNFSQIAYMTDKFGGTYIFFTIINNEIYAFYNCVEQQLIDNIDTYESIIKNHLKDMLKSRNLDEISKFINDQY